MTRGTFEFGDQCIIRFLKIVFGTVRLGHSTQLCDKLALEGLDGVGGVGTRLCQTGILLLYLIELLG